jgi:hypothetical protein
MLHRYVRDEILYVTGCNIGIHLQRHYELTWLWLLRMYLAKPLTPPVPF